MLQLQQQKARAGDTPAGVDGLLAPFGLAGLSSGPGSELAATLKSSSEPDINNINPEGADSQLAAFAAELNKFMANDGSPAATAAALPDGPGPINGKSLVVLTTAIVHGRSAGAMRMCMCACVRACVRLCMSGQARVYVCWAQAPSRHGCM